MLHAMSQTRCDLEQGLNLVGLSPVHAKTLFRSLYKELQPNLNGRSLPKAWIWNSADQVFLPRMEVDRQLQSQYDGSVKFLFKLSDGQKIESVLMPEKQRLTLCVSSQVGCAQGCTFCHTGRMGLIRNLDVDEIVGQVWMANKWISENPDWISQNRLLKNQRVTNVVFMGMGEPLDNVDHVSQAISILTDPFGFNLALRKISVSTAGHLDGLESLLKMIPKVPIALSVHAAIDHERSRIMPINRRFPLEAVLNRLKDDPIQQEQGILIQYTLIDGVNDSDEHADALSLRLSGLNAKINVIPLNPVGPSRFKSPKVENLERFRRRLMSTSGKRVLIRYSKGQDIAAACGQLVVTN